jgi:hypothetical protein
MACRNTKNFKSNMHCFCFIISMLHADGRLENRTTYRLFLFAAFQVAEPALETVFLRVRRAGVLILSKCYWIVLSIGQLRHIR